MFSILYNGSTIPLPDNDDFYTVINMEDKLYTTDFDLPITSQMINVFRLEGILTKENGSYFTPVQLPCTLQGFGLNTPCKLMLNSISQSNNTINISLQWQSIFGGDVQELQSIYNPNYVWDTRFIYPLFRTQTNPQYALSSPIYSGFVGQVPHDGVVVPFYNCTAPLIRSYDVDALVNLCGFSIASGSSFPLISFAPNALYGNKAYKMRRVQLVDTNDGGTTKTQVRAGNYGGIYDDVVTYSYGNYSYGNVFKYNNTFKFGMGARKMRVYMDMTNTYTIITAKISCSNDFRLIYNYFEYPALINNGRYEVSFNISNALPFEDNFFEMIGNIADGDCEITLNFVPLHGNVSLQYFFDDDETGVFRPPTKQTEYGVDADNTYYYRWYGFNSMDWGMTLEDYDGDFPTPTFGDNDYSQNFYNLSTALMFTNAWDWFSGISLQDIMNQVAIQSGMVFRFNLFNMTYSFDNEIKSTKLTNHILWDKLEFDNRYVNTHYEYANGFSLSDAEDSVSLSTQRLVVSEDSIYATHPDRMIWDPMTQDWYPALLMIRKTNEQPSLEDYSGYYNITRYSDIEQITDGNYIFQKPFMLSTRRMALINDKSHGFVCYTYGTTVQNYEDTATVKLFTTLNKGQVVTVRLMGYIPYQYIVYQTRTFRVLSQELGSDGVNEVTLLLYM